MAGILLKKIRKLVTEYERPKRKAISSRYHFLVGPAVFIKRMRRSLRNFVGLKTLKQEKTYLPSVIARHSSILYRKLGDSDMKLQENKVTNLKIAIAKLDGLVIPPGEVFSLWNAVGSVSKRKGYVEGMLLSNGKVAKGIGGGLCQLSNFLCWILLHTDAKIIERHHHSVDAFPDSGRTLPFGSGATIFSNYLDLQIQNTSKQPIQLKLWIDDVCLKGQVLSTKPANNKFHILEKNHYFIKHKNNYYRYNELYREKLKNGQFVKEEKLFTNFAPVAYKVNDQYFKERNYELLEV